MTAVNLLIVGLLLVGFVIIAPKGIVGLVQDFMRERASDGGQPTWREGVVTDNGNQILDIHHLQITDPEKLERELNQLPGVVCVGLFARRRADVVIVGGEPPVVL